MSGSAERLFVHASGMGREALCGYSCRIKKSSMLRASSAVRTAEACWAAQNISMHSVSDVLGIGASEIFGIGT